MNAKVPPFVWERQDVIIEPLPRSSGWSPHCQMPTPIQRDDETIRLYYTARSAQNQAHVLFVDIAAHPPYTVRNRPTQACLAPGPLGHFDAAGVMPTAVVRIENEIRLYYIGWTVRDDVPYHNAIGLAISRDNGTTFERAFEGPILSTSIIDPLFCSTAEVQRHEDGWIMWYASTTHWLNVKGKLEPRYHLRTALSQDGLIWHPTGKTVVAYRHKQEAAIARASVLRTKQGLHMWFCARDLYGYRDTPRAAYRLDYAFSNDGLTWQRAPDGCNILRGKFPNHIKFDTVMQAYPAVFETATHPLLFYNGNDFGRSGIAVARPKSVSGME